MLAAVKSCTLCRGIATGHITQLIAAIFSSRIFAVKRRLLFLHSISNKSSVFFFSVPKIKSVKETLMMVGLKIVTVISGSRRQCAE